MPELVQGNDGNIYDMGEVRAAALNLLPPADIVVERDKNGLCKAVAIDGEWMLIDHENPNHVEALRLLKIEAIEE